MIHFQNLHSINLTVAEDLRLALKMATDLRLALEVATDLRLALEVATDLRLALVAAAADSRFSSISHWPSRPFWILGVTFILQ